MNCTVGHFLSAFIWAGLPPHGFTYCSFFVVSLFWGTPILAGGIGVARSVVGDVLFLFCFQQV